MTSTAVTSRSSELVSIIIPCKHVDAYTRQCIDRCQKMDYERFEILLLPDYVSENFAGVKIISTGCVSPGRKRNVGMAEAVGDFCAFIDSDAYPSTDWLSSALKYFDDPQVAAVGGPGLTPPEDGMMQRASGYVLSSSKVGNLSSRYKAKNRFESDDIHSCNFIARKSILEKAGGWNEKYWPGEDTLICLAIKKLGGKSIESSDVVVYHHRRPLLGPHLKQISRFGLHRGFFARKFSGNSFRLTYFMPSLLVLSLLAGLFASLVDLFFLNILFLTITAYFAFSLIAAVLEVKETKLVPLVWLGIVVTHIVYGFSFLTGFMRRDLKR